MHGPAGQVAARVSADYTIEPLGEDAVLLRFGTSLDRALNARVHALAASIREDRPAWLVDIVPAFSTLALCIDLAALQQGDEALPMVRDWLGSQPHGSTSAARSDASICHEIAVRYGGEHGPDLAALAAHAGMDSAEVIRRHCSARYRVAMLGFAAGFPYLIGMDARLAMPRHATPRTHVAAGSVGIGGVQTGIYPRSGPGGWQIIGRTDARLFDAARDPPALLNPGDTVRFVDIAADDASSA